MFDEAFFNIESLKLHKQFLSIVFSEYGNYCLLFFDITSNFLEKNIYANLLTRCDDTCVITPYLYIYTLTLTAFYTSAVLRPTPNHERATLLHMTNDYHVTVAE